MRSHRTIYKLIVTRCAVEASKHHQQFCLPFPNPQRNVVHEALPLRLLGTTALGSEAPETRKSWLAISRPFLPGPAEFGFGAGKASAFWGFFICPACSAINISGELAFVQACWRFGSNHMRGLWKHPDVTKQVLSLSVENVLGIRHLFKAS